MRPFYQQILIKTIKRYLGKDRADKISDYALARQALKLKVTTRRLLKDIVFISVGILAACFGLKGFLLPKGVIKNLAKYIQKFWRFLYIFTALSKAKISEV